jgi:hypothetical protein
MMIIRVALMMVCFAGWAWAAEITPGTESVYTIESGNLRGQPGRVFWGFRVEPAVVRLGKVYVNHQTNVTVTLRLEAGSPSAVTNVVCSSSQFTTKLKPGRDGKTFEIEVVVSPLARYGNIEERLTVLTDKAWRPELVIPIVGVVNGELELSMWEIPILPGADMPVWPRYLRIKSRNGRPFGILDVVSPSPAVRIEVVRQIEDAEFVIRLAVDPDATLKDKVVRILTDVESMPEIAVPIRLQPQPTPGGAAPR